MGQGREASHVFRTPASQNLVWLGVCPTECHKCDAELLYASWRLADTKLLLTKNYSEIIIFGKITNLTRNSLKMSFFPGHFESTKSLKNYEKNNSQGIIFVIISCQLLYVSWRLGFLRNNSRQNQALWAKSRAFCGQGDQTSSFTCRHAQVAIPLVRRRSQKLA